MGQAGFQFVAELVASGTHVETDRAVSEVAVGTHVPNVPGARMAHRHDRNVSTFHWAACTLAGQNKPNYMAHVLIVLKT